MAVLRTFFQRLFYPALVFGSWGLFVHFVDRFDEQSIPLLLLAISFGAISLVITAERILPHRQEWNRNHGDFWTDFLSTNVAFPVVLQLTLTLLQATIHSDLALHWPRQLPLLVQLLLALVITEFGYYWYHRLTHESRLLWRLHSVHHGARRVYWMNSGRFHVLDLFLAFLVYLAPLVLLGVPYQVITLFILTNSITGMLEHANIDFRAGRLNYFFNTAELHRWHHSIAESESKTNYGKVLCIWDLVHGTHYFPKDSVVKVVGAGENVEIPESWLGQLYYPLK